MESNSKTEGSIFSRFSTRWKQIKPRTRYGIIGYTTSVVIYDIHNKYLYGKDVLKELKDPYFNYTKDEILERIHSRIKNNTLLITSLLWPVWEITHISSPFDYISYNLVKYFGNFDNVKDKK